MCSFRVMREEFPVAIRYKSQTITKTNRSRMANIADRIIAGESFAEISPLDKLTSGLTTHILPMPE